MAARHLHRVAARDAASNRNGCENARCTLYTCIAMPIRSLNFTSGQNSRAFREVGRFSVELGHLPGRSRAHSVEGLEPSIFMFSKFCLSNSDLHFFGSNMEK